MCYLTTPRVMIGAPSGVGVWGPGLQDGLARHVMDTSMVGLSVALCDGLQSGEACEQQSLTKLDFNLRCQTLKVL